MESMIQSSRIKGFVFDSVRREVSQSFGIDALDIVLLPFVEDNEAARKALLDPEVSALYPEAWMHDMIAQIHRELCVGDDAAFSEFVRGLAASAVNRFFKVILSLTSGAFVVRRIPLFFKRLRDGPAILTVHPTDEVFEIRYRRFPWCGDPTYRLTSMANVQSAVRAATKRFPAVWVERQDDTGMDIRIDLEGGDDSLSALPRSSEAPVAADED